MDIITAEELNRRIEAGEDLRLLDVRESFEANISDFRMETLSIPVASLDEQLHKLDKEKEYIVYCRSGNTSKKAVELLLENGFEHVKNLEGGINGWAQKFDPSLPQY
ncbi:MAG TPA: rhodanese-like domain-containing protein [Balneolaceae bacterium]|nr:rhodanese-like domain-containing protein [Balneolaceae bacterium]